MFKSYTRYFGIVSPDRDELDIQLNLILPRLTQSDRAFKDVLTRFTTKNRGFKISGIYTKRKTGQYIDNLDDLKYSGVYGYENLQMYGPHIVLTYDTRAPLNSEGLVPIQADRFDGYRRYEPAYLKLERQRRVMEQLELLAEYNVPKDIAKYIIPEYIGYDYYDTQ